MKRDLSLLTSPPFLAGLALLLANDLLLKPLFHNALTGKLSDFSGLFVFPLFWTAFAPRRSRLIHALTALGFALWKSPLSQPLVEAWNALPLFDVRRTVDATDLLALSALPASYLYARRRRQRDAVDGRPAPFAPRARRLATCAAVLLSVFAFAATSYRTPFTYEGEQFVFADSAEGLLARLKKLTEHVSQGNNWASSSAPEEYSMWFKTDCCCGQVYALIELREQGPGLTRMTLRRLEHHCPESGDDKAKMLSAFLRKVVVGLQEDIDAHPPARGEAARPPAARRRAL